MSTPPIIELPKPKVVIYHPRGETYQVFLYDEDGNHTGTVTFSNHNEGKDLAYEYYEFKTHQEKAMNNPKEEELPATHTICRWKEGSAWEFVENTEPCLSIDAYLRAEELQKEHPDYFYTLCHDWNKLPPQKT